MRTVIYARFSSTLQNARSTEDQIALCRERCVREGWDIVGVYRDEAISGAAGIGESDRPGLNTMLQHVEAGGVDQVLAEATDRIARHQGDAFAIRERVTFAGARIFTLSDGEVTEITATFRGLMDAQFRKDLAAKVKRGQRGTLADGRHPAGIAYGYRTANRLDERGHLIRGLREIDEDQAEIVRRIFREFAAGRSPRAIAEQLNADAIPAAQPRSGNSSWWRASTIYGDRKRKNGILQNRLYVGTIVFNRTRKVIDPKTRKALIIANPESDWQMADAPELRIISDDLWGAVQSMLGEVQARKPEASRRPKHLLSGMATCGTCGGAWVSRGANRWGCARNKEGGPAACSNGRTISTALMEDRVLYGLQHEIADPEALDTFVREYHLEYARTAKAFGRDSERLRRRHADASAKVERLVLAIAQGGDEFVEIREMLGQARTERDAAAVELANVEQLPVVALHPKIVANYRAQVADLAAMLNGNPAARLNSIPKLRALIGPVIIRPADNGQRGVKIEFTTQLAAMLALATGKPVSVSMWGNDGAGEGNHSLPQFLRAVV